MAKRDKNNPRNWLTKINFSFDLDPETKRGIAVVIMFTFSLISILAIFNLAGSLGGVLKDLLQSIFGWSYVAAPFILIIIAYLITKPERYYVRGVNWLGTFLFILSATGFFHLFKYKQGLLSAAIEGTGGGYLGLLTAYPLIKLWGVWASGIFLIGVWLVSLLLIFETSLETMASKFKFISWFLDKMRSLLSRLKSKDELESQIIFDTKDIEDQDGEETESTQDVVKNKKNNKKEKDNPNQSQEVGEQSESQSELFPETKKRYPKIELPIDFLTGKVSKPTSRDIKSVQEVIKKTLNHFGIEVEMGEVSIGATFTQFTLKPADGVKLSKIVALTNDLSLALAAHPIRIEAPIPNKSLVGIEIPNQKVALVSLKEILTSQEFKERKSNLMIALGSDVSGKAWLWDLSRMPHLLIAGATGSGKTVALNSIIVSLLYQNQPNELKFILVDPKRVELPVYNNIPHLITPVIIDVTKTVSALKWSTQEMERRFQVLSSHGKKKLSDYNNSVSDDKKLPYIVIVVDELADLMAVAANEVETAIIRLSQMARAVGIHLVLATQRPSVDVITGLIKANITSRMAFSVASQIDSRTILDHSGAEKLLGRGDMLFLTPEIAKPKRIQGAFLSDDEIERVVNYLKQKSEPEYDESVVQKVSEDGGLGGLNLKDDPLLPKARELIIQTQKASTSYLQRRLSLGYARAARLMDLLEEEGTIGPQDGARAREVLVTREEYLGEVDASGTTDILELNQDSSDDVKTEGYHEDSDDIEEDSVSENSNKE